MASSLLSIKTTWKNDIRRIKIDGDAPDAFERLLTSINALYKQAPQTKFVVKYVDDEDEQITVSSTEELMEACRIAGADNRKSLKLFLERMFDDEEQDFVQIDDNDDTSSIATGVTVASVSTSAAQSPTLLSNDDTSSIATGVTVASVSTSAAQSPTLLSKGAVEAFSYVNNNKTPEAPAAPSPRKEEVITVTYPSEIDNNVQVPVVKADLVFETPAPAAAPDVDTDSKTEQTTPTFDDVDSDSKTATPVSAPELPLPSADEILALVLDFMQQEDAERELQEGVKIAVNGLLASKSVAEVVSEILFERPKIAQSPLACQLIPHLSTIAAAAHGLDISSQKLEKIVRFLPQMLKACQPTYLGQILQNLSRGDMSNFVSIENDELVIDVFPREALAPVQVEESIMDESGRYIHRGVMCDVCEMNPIVGSRFKCTVCPNYDLCEACEAKGDHPVTHVLMKIRQPSKEFGAWRCHRGRGGFRHGRCGNGRLPKAEFVAHKTIPEGSAVLPGANLLKVWQIKNVGSSAWPENTELVFVNGTVVPAQGAGYRSIVLSAQPGEIVDISVDVAAPATPGRQVGNFRLRSPSGHFFGHRVWVTVDVVDDATARAQEAALKMAADVEASRQAAAEAEEARLADQARLAEQEARLAEQARLAEEAEQARVAAEVETARLIAEAEREEKDRAEAEALKQNKLAGFKYLNELKHLEDLGFTDLDLNMYMLLNHRGDLQRVVDWLLENATHQ